MQCAQTRQNIKVKKKMKQTDIYYIQIKRQTYRGTRQTKNQQMDNQPS